MGHDYGEDLTARNSDVTRGQRFAVTMTHDAVIMTPFPTQV
jgi:hypothetical protein